MILDLHTHTCNSHDGFTSEDELLAACIARGVSAVAVTEHDLSCAVDPAPFAAHGIELIPGCEFTDANNAHIVGLFVRKSLPLRLPSEAILDYIHEQGGLAVMPHPWKQGSGFMAMGGDISLVRRFDFIELINGGWRSMHYSSQIIDLAYEHGIRMISSSDSHKASQVGLCCIRIASVRNGDGARATLEGAKQDDIEMLIDRKVLEKHGRHSNAIQRSTTYQALLPVIPKRLRRLVKFAHYYASADRQALPPNFELINIGSSIW